MALIREFLRLYIHKTKRFRLAEIESGELPLSKANHTAIVQHLAARTIGLLCTNHRVGLPPFVIGLKPV